MMFTHFYSDPHFGHANIIKQAQSDALSAALHDLGMECARALRLPHVAAWMEVC